MRNEEEEEVVGGWGESSGREVVEGGWSVASQVGTQKKRGSGCSVPFPLPACALPGANSHWISGGSRGGEQTQTAPLLKNIDMHY